MNTNVNHIAMIVNIIITVNIYICINDCHISHMTTHWIWGQVLTCILCGRVLTLYRRNMFLYLIILIHHNMLLLSYQTDKVQHNYVQMLQFFCVTGVRRYRASHGESQPHWTFPCRCDNGCDTDTGECLNGGSCIQGQPTEYTWSGQACRTGNVTYSDYYSICHI